MFIKFILDNKEVTYEELQQAVNNLDAAFGYKYCIKLDSIKSDGTLIFEKLINIGG
jgi:hypothetical protein